MIGDPCRACGDCELVRNLLGPGLVCMACGHVQPIGDTADDRPKLDPDRSAPDHVT